MTGVKGTPSSPHSPFSVSQPDICIVSPPLASRGSFQHSGEILQMALDCGAWPFQRLLLFYLTVLFPHCLPSLELSPTGMLKSLYNWSIILYLKDRATEVTPHRQTVPRENLASEEKSCICCPHFTSLRTETVSDCPSVIQLGSIRDQIQTQVCLTSSPSSFQNPLLWPKVSKWAKPEELSDAKLWHLSLWLGNGQSFNTGAVFWLLGLICPGHPSRTSLLCSTGLLRSLSLTSLLACIKALFTISHSVDINWTSVGYLWAGSLLFLSSFICLSAQS